MIPATTPTVRYTVEFEPRAEGGVAASVPALPGCAAGGETLEEARERAREAIRSRCEAMLGRGLSLPPDVIADPPQERLAVILDLRRAP